MVLLHNYYFVFSDHKGYSPGHVLEKVHLQKPLPSPSIHSSTNYQQPTTNTQRPIPNDQYPTTNTQQPSYCLSTLFTTSPWCILLKASSQSSNDHTPPMMWDTSSWPLAIRAITRSQIGQLWLKLPCKVAFF